MNLKVLVDYGMSRYGGWYANFNLDGWTGVHANTKKELAQKLDSVIGVDAWTFNTRFDN